MSDSCRDYHEGQDAAKGIIGLILMLFFAVVCIYDCVGKDEREARQRKEHAAEVAACTVVVEHGAFYADPATYFCGSKNGKQYLPGSIDACYKVLLREEFAEIRHCWKDVMQKAAQK